MYARVVKALALPAGLLTLESFKPLLLRFAYAKIFPRIVQMRFIALLVARNVQPRFIIAQFMKLLS